MYLWLLLFHSEGGRRHATRNLINKMLLFMFNCNILEEENVTALSDKALNHNGIN